MPKRILNIHQDPKLNNKAKTKILMSTKLTFRRKISKLKFHVNHERI